MVTALMGAAVSFGPGRAEAASTAGSVRILTPAYGSLVTGRRLTVRVRAGRGVSHLQLRFAGRPLTMLPGSAGGVRTGIVSLKGLPKGRLSLLLQARGGGHSIAQSRNLVVGRRAPGLLRHVALPARASGAVRMRVHLGGQATRFLVRLDGRPVRLLRQPTTGATPIPLSADDGLRPGPNRVTVLAYRDADGAWDRATRTVRISRREPLVAAGPDRRKVAGATIRLDGRRSRPARRDEALSYDWRIVAHPRSHGAPAARLTDPHGSRPRLAVRVPRTYKVALRVAGRRPPHGTKTAPGAAAPR